MKTDKRRAIVLWIAGILVGIAVLAGSIVVVTSKSYFDNHHARNSPVWLADLFLKARRLSGQFREPPSNEEMIRYFHEHEAEFERLVTDYYDIIRHSYDSRIFPDRNELLKFQMAELGIGRVTTGGPGYSTSVYGKDPLLTLGMNLYLIDHGGSLTAYPDAGKAYSFAPRLSDQAVQKVTPITHYLYTYQYELANGIPNSCEKQRILCCGLQEISANWAVTTCVNTSN
jgi:hypothetical protein